MNKKLHLVLAVVLAAILAVSVTMVIRLRREDQARAASYEKAAQIAQAEPSAAESEAPVPIPEELKDFDLAALQEVNPEVTGWICIPGTELSYPLLRGEDNEYYLKHAWDREPNSGGAIYIDCRCPADLTNFNTIIYGHRMRNGSMFATLKYYKDQAFWQEHPAVYIADGTGVHAYDVFAAWEPKVSSVVYKADFDTDEERQEFLDTCLDGSELDTGITPELDDRLLTLSTCTGQGHATRWVVQARLAWEYDGDVK